MAVAEAGSALVHRYGRHVRLESQATALAWFGTTVAVALGDGHVHWIADDGAMVATAAAHAGAILAACRHPDGAALVTGGDDGRVCRVSPEGAVAELGTFGRKWVEHLVASPTSGLLVAGIGREAIAWRQGATAPSHRYAFDSTLGGLALDAKGKRLAVTHYNGATLLYGTNPDSGRTCFRCTGSHLACTLDPSGRFLLTALQETGLHGWRLTDLRDMRMTGYAAKTRSFSWDRRGKWLATSGDAAAILWPFDGKDGPMGKAPQLRGERKGALVTQVAFHPSDEVLAIGYDDGIVALARRADEHTLLLDTEGARITALAWNEAGSRLGWGGEDGRIGLLAMDARA